MRVHGVVMDFDDYRGDGTILSDAGERLYFHCVSLQDGSRHVEAGKKVTGQRQSGHLGHDEVGEINSTDS